jgi:hypothetical protein
MAVRDEARPGTAVEILIAGNGAAQYEPGVIVARYPCAYDGGVRYTVKRDCDGKVFENCHRSSMRVLVADASRAA